MKLIEFTQCKVEGEDEPRVIPLGRISMERDYIIGVAELCDKYNSPIKGAIILRDRHGDNALIAATYDEVVEKLTTEEFI